MTAQRTAVERTFLAALPPNDVEALLADGHEIAVAAPAIAAPSAYPSHAALNLTGPKDLHSRRLRNSEKSTTTA